MRRVAAVVALLLLATCAQARTVRIIELQHRDARIVSSWLEDGIANGRWGIAGDQIDKVECIARDNAIVVSGEDAAIERIGDLLAQVDVPVRQIEIRCKMVELEEPELLLGGVAPPTVLQLADGSRVEVPPEAVPPDRPGWPLPEDETGTLLAINPHVDVSVLEGLLDNGRVTVMNEPRITTLQGMPGYIGFATDHEGKVYGPRFGFMATMTDDELITVEASLHWDEPPVAGVVSPNVHIDVRYTAPGGQTVAVGVLPKSEAVEAEGGIVFLITARPVRDLP